MNLEASLEQILESNHQFGEMFYDIFFEEYPEAKDYFEGTNMRGQAMMLSVALRLMGDYHARGFAAIEHYLQVLGTRHSDRRIPREMYPKWRDALLATLAHFHDSDWNDTLAAEWRDAIDAVSEVMFKGYDERSSV
jgi:hemoglobin-like flavoprotein